MNLISKQVHFAKSRPKKLLIHFVFLEKRKKIEHVKIKFSLYNSKLKFFGGERIFIVNRVLSFSNYLQVFQKMLRIQNVMEKRKKRGNFIKI